MITVLSMYKCNESWCIMIYSAIQSYIKDMFFIHCLLTGLHKWTWPGTAFMVELMTFSPSHELHHGNQTTCISASEKNSTEIFLFTYSCLYWKNENQLNGRKKMLNFLSLLIKEIIEILYTLTGCGFFIKKKI